MSKNFTSYSVIHVVSSLEVGGAERFVIDLCQFQAKQGYRVAILSFGKQCDSLVAECKPLGVKVYHTPNGHLKKWYGAYLALKAFHNIHFHSPYALKFMLPILPVLLNHHVVYTRHGAYPFSEKAWIWVHKLACFFVNNVSFVSHEGAKIFTQTHGWAGKIKHVIDNGVNLAEIEVDRKPSNKLRIGSVGRMVELKNQMSLLQALAATDDLTRNNIEVHFFGAGPLEFELQSYAQTHHLMESVTFHGMMRDRNKIYNSFDVLVVTSETEGLSLAIIEAMAYLCPILATNVGGNPKLVEHGKNGFLFEYNDIDNLEKLILSLYGNHTLIQQFAKYSREKIEQQFSLSVCAEKYQTLYE